MAMDTKKQLYFAPMLTSYGDLKTLTQLAGSGAVDAILGVDIDGDGDADTVIGNGSAPVK